MPNDPPFVATRAGAGPRHIAFHPQMPWAYVINELGSSVTTYRFDAQRGSLQPIQILPSIPASYTGNNTGAEIAVAPSGRVVYASNRGHDSIAAFAVDRRDGTLTPVGWAPTHAKSPRFMEYRGVTFTVVQTIWKGWRWSVDQGERESAGTASNRTTAICRAERFIDDLLRRREQPKASN